MRIGSKITYIGNDINLRNTKGTLEFANERKAIVRLKDEIMGTTKITVPRNHIYIHQS